MVFFWAMAKQHQGLVNSLYFHPLAQGESSPPLLRCSTLCRWCLSIQVLLPCQRLQDFLSTLCLRRHWAHHSPDHSCQGSRADNNNNNLVPDSAMLVNARLTWSTQLT